MNPSRSKLTAVITFTLLLLIAGFGFYSYHTDNSVDSFDSDSSLAGGSSGEES